MKVQVSRNRFGSFVVFLLAASCSSPALFDTEPTEDSSDHAGVANDAGVASDAGGAGGEAAGRDGAQSVDAARDARDASDGRDASLVDADAQVEAEAGPTFPYDTRRLVAALAPSPTANADLYVISTTTGTAPVPITQTPNRHELAPRWSPDHTKIAFFATAGRPGTNPSSNVDLLVVDADGSNERLLVSGVDGSLWPPTWSPDGTRIAYLHGLPSCAPPWDPNWYVADPCIDDLHAVRLSDGVDEDLGLMPPNDKFGLEPAWLSDGKLSYFWMCRGEGCNEEGGWYRNLPLGTSLGTQWPTPSIYAGFAQNAWFRQRAHKRDPRYWVSVELPVGSSGSPAGAVHDAGARGGDQGPIVLCTALNTNWTGGIDADCPRLVDDPMAWSPRWNPEETRVAYQRTDGLWVTAVPVSPGVLPTQLFAWSGEILGFDW